VLAFNESIRWNHIVGFILMVLSVYFVFKKWFIRLLAKKLVK
jgi:uncharacterized protein (DUF486 family)